jgi:hypothetical protein
MNGIAKNSARKFASMVIFILALKGLGSVRHTGPYS